MLQAVSISRSSLRLIATGALTMSSVSVLRLLVQLLSVPVLARFLSPEEYGLAAMAMPVILFLMMLADSGLGSSLVRTSETDEPAWHTCFWLSAGLGAVAAMAVVLISPVVAALLNEPRIRPILTALAAVIPLQTLTLVPGAALQQQRRFGSIAATEIASTGTSLGTAVACAVAGFGVWALVWQQIVFYAVRLTFTLALSPFRPRLIFDLRDASEHIIFGRNLLGATLISSGSRTLESFFIGRLCGPSALGVYAMAFQFARLPFMLVTGPLQYVLYPYIAALRDDKAKLAGLFLVLTRVLALVVCPAVGVIAAASDPVFHLLLSKKWGHAAPIFVLIAPAAALQPVTAILSTFLMGLGRTDVQMRLAGQLAAVWLVGLTLSVWHGIEAVAVAYSLCVFLFSLWTMRIGLPLVDCSFRDYLHALLWPLTLSVSAALLYRMVKLTAPADEVMNVCLAAALAITASALALIAQRHALLAALSFPAKGV